MRRRLRNLLLLALPFLLLASCSRTDRFTVASTKSLNMVLLPEAHKGRHTGHDVRHILFIFPTGMPDLRKAADDALEDGEGNLLVNADAYIRYWWIPPLYGQIAYVVNGEVYDIQATAREGELEEAALMERRREERIRTAEALGGRRVEQEVRVGAEREGDGGPNIIMQPGSYYRQKETRRIERTEPIRREGTEPTRRDGR